MRKFNDMMNEAKRFKPLNAWYDQRGLSEVIRDNYKSADKRGFHVSMIAHNPDDNTERKVWMHFNSLDDFDTKFGNNGMDVTSRSQTAWKIHKVYYDRNAPKAIPKRSKKGKGSDILDIQQRDREDYYVPENGNCFFACVFKYLEEN